MRYGIGEKKDFFSNKNFLQIVLVVDNISHNLMDARGNKIIIDREAVVEAQTIFEQGGVVAKAIMERITPALGLREAIVKLMMPDFSSDNSFEEILVRLEKTAQQNKELQGLGDKEGVQVSVLKTSKGGSLDFDLCIDELKRVIAFLQEFKGTSEYPSKLKMVKVNFGQRVIFTRNGGLREAVYRALENEFLKSKQIVLSRNFDQSQVDFLVIFWYNIQVL